MKTMAFLWWKRVAASRLIQMAALPSSSEITGSLVASLLVAALLFPLSANQANAKNLSLPNLTAKEAKQAIEKSIKKKRHMDWVQPPYVDGKWLKTGRLTIDYSHYIFITEPQPAGSVWVGNYIWIAYLMSPTSDSNVIFASVDDCVESVEISVEGSHPGQDYLASLKQFLDPKEALRFIRSHCDSSSSYPHLVYCAGASFNGCGGLLWEFIDGNSYEVCYLQRSSGSTFSLPNPASLRKGCSCWWQRDK